MLKIPVYRDTKMAGKLPVLLSKIPKVFNSQRYNREIIRDTFGEKKKKRLANSFLPEK